MSVSSSDPLLNALLNELDPHQDRLVVIEETAEMQVESENVTRFQCRTSRELQAITIRDLVKIADRRQALLVVALRHRPDHLVIGEIRGAEAMDLLDALNTGNSGSMTTIHANSAASALTKLSNLALRASADIPHAAIQAQIADVLTYVVHMDRRGDHRFVAEVVRVSGYDFDSERLSYLALPKRRIAMKRVCCSVLAFAMTVSADSLILLNGSVINGFFEPAK